MVSENRKQVIRCPNRKRDVEVIYAVSGAWFTSKYDIVACPAMYESTESCNRQCQTLLARPPKYMPFDMFRV